MDNNLQEANFFGITKSMRTGFFTAILGFSLISNIYLYNEVQKKNEKLFSSQEKMYERIIETTNRVNMTVDSITLKSVNK